MKKRRWGDPLSDKGSKRYRDMGPSPWPPVLWLLLQIALAIFLAAAGIATLIVWWQMVLIGDTENALFWQRLWAALTNLHETFAQDYLKKIYLENLGFTAEAILP